MVVMEDRIGAMLEDIIKLIKCTAIGFWAGGNWNNNGGTGDFSVAIGADAGGSGGAPYKTIIINATGNDLSPSTQEAFFVKP